MKGLLLAVAAGACGCGAGSPPAGERTAASASAIQSGTPDSAHTFAVAVIQRQSAQQWAFCSGALLAPNLVATARHCVAQLANSFIDCATSTFGALVPTSELVVTTDAVVSGNTAFIGVASVVVPTDPGQDKVCGNDIALLVLQSPVALPQYVTPVLFPPMTDQSVYSTSVTAIGYGIYTPTDTNATTAGTRRIKENVALRCIPNDNTFTDCFGDPSAGTVMTRGEFISGDASTCEGDSGSSAFEQRNFSQGKWVSFGVLSRGSVSTDGQTCVEPIYTRFDAWAPLLLQAANQAAAAGGYAAPPWAVAAGSADSGGAGAGKADGVSCSANAECLSSNCVSLGTTSFVCASPCSSSACAPGFECSGGPGGFCFPSPPQGGEASRRSGGCAVGRGEPYRPAAVLAFLGLLAFAAARRRES
jgi:secreted trypsin-like serine protease